MSSNYLLWRQGDQNFKWRLLNVHHCFLFLSFFSQHILLVDLCKGLIRIRLLSKKSCDPYVKNTFLTAILQSSHRNILPCIVRWIEFSFKFLFIDWQKCGFYLYRNLMISTESLIDYVTWSLSLSWASLNGNRPVCLSGCDLQSLFLNTSTGNGYALYLSSISHAYGIREFLFVCRAPTWGSAAPNTTTTLYHHRVARFFYPKQPCTVPIGAKMTDE